MSKSVGGYTWFPLDVLDFQKRTRGMGPEQIAAFIVLLTVQWTDGQIPQDSSRIAEMIQPTRLTKGVRAMIEEQFPRVQGRGKIRRAPWLHAMWRDRKGKIEWHKKFTKPKGESAEQDAAA